MREKLPWLACMLALILGGLSLASHEMWRDELQAWTIARDSASVSQLFYNLRCDGHPPLWHLVLLFLSRLTTDPRAMQILHFFIAATTLVFIVLRSPFRAWQKSLLCFHYYLNFEYFVISRGYALGALFLLLACHVFAKEQFRGRLLLFTLLIAGMLVTSAYSFILACAMTCMFAYSLVTGREERSGATVLVLVVLAVTALSSIAFTKPPAECAFIKEYAVRLWPAALVETFSGPWIGLCPVPQPKVDFWNSNILRIGPLRAVLSLAIIVVLAVALKEKPVALSLYSAGLVGYLGFSNTVLFGLNRHHGHVFLLFVAAFWLAGGFPPLARGQGILRRLGWPVVTVILVAGAVAGLACHIVEWQQLFSGGKQMASFIEQQGWQERIIVAHEDSHATTVSGYLRRQLYYPSIDGLGSFVVWNAHRLRTDRGRALEEAKRLARHEGEPVLFLSSEAIPQLTPLFQSTARIERSETFWLYEISPD